jgi:hypothetical protein
MSLKPRRSIHASLNFGATSQKAPLNWLAHDLFLLLVFSLPAFVSQHFSFYSHCSIV